MTVLAVRGLLSLIRATQLGAHINFMRMINMKNKISRARRAYWCAMVLLLPCSIGASSGAVAAEEENLICAAVDVNACIDNGICDQGTAQDFDVPTFMIIDFERKQINTRGEVDGEAVSHIRSNEMSKDSIVLQGFEEGRGWTLAINRATGHMRLSSTGPSMNFTITGNCIRL